MRQGLFPHKQASDKPLSRETIQRELSRLCDEDTLPKTEIAPALFFKTVEKHFRSTLDSEATLPQISAPYLYMSDEGFMIVFTVLYSLFRAACKEMFTSSEENGENVLLILEGKTQKKSVCDALALTDKGLATLSLIARASGFSLDASLAEGVLRLCFSFVRFRAIPISSYSLSEDFLLDKMYRAFRLFMRDGSGVFDF